METTQIQQLSAYLDGELDTVEKHRIEDALAESAKLRDELQRLRAVRAWAHNFPGRQPGENVWAAIETGITLGGASQQHVVRSRKPGPRKRFSAFLEVLPFYSREHGWSNGAKRTAIFGLAGIAIAGMGRSFYQEQRANLYEEKSRFKDQQLLRAETEANWNANATSLRGQNGHRLTVRCPRGGRPGLVWGSGVYTDDSSICTAAVHAGLMEFDQGGQVLVEIRPGLDDYEGTERNGVSSLNFGHYDGSFAFVLDEGSQPFTYDFRFNFEDSPAESPRVIAWDEDAERFRGLEGAHLELRCEAGGRLHSVWGSGPYTDDSSICSAATHAGLITPVSGGDVQVVIGGRYPRFVGSERHGVDSRAFGTWDGSFSFVTEHGQPVGETVIESIDWGQNARQMRGWDGFTLSLYCPPGGEPEAIWGTDIYTDDSSICTAAVHAGLISTKDGGPVTIQIGPGMHEYRSTTQNGLESSAYGEWSGSFRFLR